MAKRKPARSKARSGATAASARRPARGRTTVRRTSTRATSTTRTATRPAAKQTSSRRAAPKPKASTTSSTRATSRPSKPAAPKPAARKTAARPSAAKSPRRAAAPARATSTAGRTAEPRRSGAGGRSQGSLRRQIARDRRLIQEEVPTPPSSLDLDRRPSAARAGRAELEEALAEHTAAGPGITGGDVDAEWQSAYTVGDTAPGGDMPTPDQDVVEEIGNAVGLSYKDDEELKGAGKVEERDRHRWELDPASSEDYPDRTRRKT